MEDCEKIGGYTPHPLANMFPLMQGQEYEALVRDVRENGLREPVVRWNVDDGWFILDGRNRARACLDAPRKCEFVDFDGTIDEARRLVVSLNVARRHLNESQRAMVAARLANLGHGERADVSNDTSAPITQPEAAALLSVSAPSVKRARKVIDHGVEELVAAVDSGLLRVSDAAKVAGLPDHADQLEVVRRVESGEARNAAQAMRHIEREKRTEAAPKLKGKQCQILLGDATAQIKALKVRPHCVVTDPPYGITTHNTRDGGKQYSDGEDYALTLLDRVARALLEKCDPSAHIYVFSGYTYAWRFREVLIAAGWEIDENPIIWVKENHTMCDFAKHYPNKHEYVWFGRVPGSKRGLTDCVPDVITCKRQGDTSHTAEKPVELLARFVEQSTAPGELVIDPFVGSGAGAVAAVQIGRKFIGIDEDQKWVQTATARAAEALKTL